MELARRTPHRVSPYETQIFECPYCESVLSLTLPEGGRLPARLRDLEDKVAVAEFRLGRQKLLIKKLLVLGDDTFPAALVQIQLEAALQKLRAARNTLGRHR
jgi:hypothetical protein